jgi:GrpB-like predicted nucleotidyltransferase (UPF0157 family)/ribosomal protein S18 acetylase RimI-like enzyme/predicted nucleotidyltransferase
VEPSVQIDLVPCSQDDRDFAFRVTEESMRSYVEEAFGAWDSVAQRRRLDDSINPSSWNVVLVDDVRAGILVVEDRPAELFLLRIFLLPAFQRRGVGTALMRRLINRARVAQKPLRLRVLHVNAGARRLYERLGFALTRSTTEHAYLELLPTDDRRPKTEEEIRVAHVGQITPLHGRVLIVDYDPRWARLFEDEAVRIRRALQDRALRVEHVGSTSVPGLAAKPVIDIVLVVVDSADEAAYVPFLEAAGYRLDVREGDWYEHRMFKGPDADVNLHTFSAGCAEVDRMLAFRDWLRANRADRELYAQTKLDLAQREWTFVQNYADAKNNVIDQIMARARAAGASDAPDGAATRFLRLFTEWAAAQPDIQAVALVGSHARRSARPTSDIDLVILASEPERFLADTTWVETFGTPVSASREDYGNVTSLRVRYQDAVEVEFGFTTVRWADVPVDPGTRDVISAGMRVLVERGPILSRLL